MNSSIIPNYACYEEKINLELYNAFVGLVVGCCKDTHMAAWFQNYRRLLIWQEINTSDYFDQYQLRYPGEVLERFGEKIGSDLRNLRALALALGRTVPLQSSEMFIGKQRIAFIQKVRQKAAGDPYLQGALCLLETSEATRQNMVDTLMQAEYNRTEEALFVLSLLDDTAEGYRQMRDQLIRLFGPGRTISLIGNAGVLEWFIFLYAKEIKGQRKKADQVLRTLLKFPYTQMKPGSREFAILTEAGYNTEEIVMANALLLDNTLLPDKLPLEGIKAEKIAVSCCEMLLNREQDLPEPYYEYLTWLMRRYDRFGIQYQGYAGIKQALCDRVKPTAPKTLIWLWKYWKDLPLRFDVFDTRYDLLARELPVEQYTILFTKQMLRIRKETPGKRWRPVKRWMRRYRKLTGRNYCDAFVKWFPEDYPAFQLLVEQKTLNLWTCFEQSKGQEERKYLLDHLRYYGMAVQSRTCFRFVRRLLEYYSFPELEECFGQTLKFHEYFLERTNRYNYKINLQIGRGFLTPEEKRQLFDWIETSCFLTAPDKYTELAWAAIRSPEIQTLYDKKELASVLRQLLSEKAPPIDRYELKNLKEQLYAADELDRERQEAAAESARAERIRREENHQRQVEGLRKSYDGTLESLLKYTSSCYRSEERTEAWKLVYDLLMQWKTGSLRSCSTLELQSFFEICAGLLEYETRPKNEILSLIERMIGGAAA